MEVRRQLPHKYRIVPKRPPSHEPGYKSNPWLRAHLLLAMFVPTVLGSCRLSSPTEQSWVKVPPRAPLVETTQNGWKSVPPAVYAQVRRSVTKRVVQLNACSRDASIDLKPQIQQVLVSELSSPGLSFAPPETARLIHEVFDPEIPACAGETCTKVSGVRFGPNLREEMGALKNLAQKIAPGSVRSFDSIPAARDTEERSSPPTLTRRKFCGMSLLSAFSLLNPPVVNAVALAKIPGADQSFDLRKNNGMEDQDFTGSCHAFATAEVLRHGKLNLPIDIARYFVDYWLYRMGPDLDSVLKTEILMQREFAKSLTGKMIGLKSDEEKKAALSAWMESQGSDVASDPQGGWVDLDLASLQSRGAVLADSPDLRPVTFKELGEINKTILEARITTLVTVVREGLETITDRDIMEGVRESYGKLFAIASESKNHPSRAAVKKALKGYKMLVRKFDRSQMEKSVATFFKRLNKQPAYLSANHHGTALVGYDQARKIFIVRNSNYQTYSELNVDEVFNNLDKYAVLEQTPPP